MRISSKIISPIWSIKVFRAGRPLVEQPNEGELAVPTLQASDVKDVPAEFVADPFILLHEGCYYLFFEVLNKASGRGEVGLATSGDGAVWKYEKIVLSERFHLSYPHVFRHENDMYMLPESVEANRVLLYKSKVFPFLWEPPKELIAGRYTDPTIFRYNERWWMFGGSKGKDLHLFYTEELEGYWKEHPLSPVITNNSRISRPGGRVIVDQNRIYRYTQDCHPLYGAATRVFRITVLSETEYREEEINLILRGTERDDDWRKDGMHHIDQLKLSENEWMIAVDGHHFQMRNYCLWKLDRIIAKWR